MYKRQVIDNAPATPHTALKTSATTEDVLPKTPLLFDQPMQRSASTPSAETQNSITRNNNVASTLVAGTTNSLFSINASIPPATNFNKTLSLEAVTGSPPLPANSYSSLNMFLANESAGVNGNGGISPGQPLQVQQKHASELDNFFQQQSAGWIEGNSSSDDFLGWFDINMAPEF